MKQVRFDTPRGSDPRLRTHAAMQEARECQVPRPPATAFTHPASITHQHYPILPLPCSDDALECSKINGSAPYPLRSRSILPTWERRSSGSCLPSSELELSRLDSDHESSKLYSNKRLSTESHPKRLLPRQVTEPVTAPNELPQALKLPEFVDLPNIFKGDSITKSNVSEKIFVDGGRLLRSDKSINTFTYPNCDFTKNKESPTCAFKNTLKTKEDFPNVLPAYSVSTKTQQGPVFTDPKNIGIESYSSPYALMRQSTRNLPCPSACIPPPQQFQYDNMLEPSLWSPCLRTAPVNCRHLHGPTVPCYSHLSPQWQRSIPKYHPKPNCGQSVPETLSNSVEAEVGTVEKYEQTLKASENCMDVDKQTKSPKEKREPTVSDLFKIIKLQNEQLKLLQDRVDRLLVNTYPNLPDNAGTQFRPVQNFVQENVAMETIDNHHKISIGVMTSFEVVRTSTMNTERVVKNTAQIQCNRSQISIKGVISAAEQCNSNFLDGIAHVNQNTGQNKNVGDVIDDGKNCNEDSSRHRYSGSPENGNNEKTFNEMSLCNFQMDSAVTPQLSPDQTIYLDVKDYSDSENEDESHVGWTYYNKVMNHVNEMLQESCVPSSAGALHRRAVAAVGTAADGGAVAAAGARCTRLHVDRTDVSVTTSKRVTFGEHPPPLEPPRAFPPAVSSDTSLQMNRLAAKYLRSGAAGPAARARREPPLDMSLATRKYMEQHNLLGDGVANQTPAVPTKFLDITALKQQPKLL